jgi:hypothetical protein
MENNWLDTHPNRERKCQECGQIFSLSDYREIHTNRRFCDRYCWYLHRNRNTETYRRSIVKLFEEGKTRKEITTIMKKSRSAIEQMLYKKPLNLSPVGWVEYDKWLPSKFSTSRARTQAIILAKAQIRMKESKGGKSS